MSRSNLINEWTSCLLLRYAPFGFQAKEVCNASLVQAISAATSILIDTTIVNFYGILQDGRNIEIPVGRQRRKKSGNLKKSAQVLFSRDDISYSG